MQCLRVTGAAQLYAGAMSPPAAEQIISALQLIQDADGTGRGPRKLSQLRENSNYFREKLQDIGLNVLGDRDSPVMVRVPGRIMRMQSCCAHTICVPACCTSPLTCAVYQTAMEMQVAMHADAWSPRPGI